jgi:HK97 gp10 family phage protein
MAATIKIVYNNLPKLAKRFPEAVSAIVRKTALDVEANAKAIVPVDTGTLKNSIQMEMTSPTSAIVSAHAEYAEAVEYGTRPHVIRPKSKKALYWPGASHPVMMVSHPGSRAKPFMRPAAEKVKQSFLAALQRLEDQVR